MIKIITTTEFVISNQYGHEEARADSLGEAVCYCDEYGDSGEVWTVVGANGATYAVHVDHSDSGTFTEQRN